ncbi:MAG: ABC transporter permease subunit [Armatimonadota bacterium]|nr:ABC transporter permease subunit [Armatimonadota bacterium]
MPIIPMVGRRGWKLRLVLIALYGVVIVGAITVLYPFLLMVSLGFTSAVDFDDMRLIPKYLSDDGELYRKYIYEKWSSGITTDGRLKYPLHVLSDRYSLAVKDDFLAPREVEGWYKKDAKEKDTKEPFFDGSDPQVRMRVKDWNKFRAALPANYFDICMGGGGVLPGPSSKSFGNMLEKRYGANLEALNYAYGGEAYASFFAGSISGDVPAMGSDLLLRRDWWACGSADDKARTGKLDEPVLLRQLDWYTFKASTHYEWRQVVAGRFDYQRFLLKKVELVPEDEDELQRAALKKEFGITYRNLRDISLPATVPSNPAEAKLWEEFVRTKWSPRFMRAIGGTDLFIAYLKRHYGSIDKVNAAWGTNFSSFDSKGVFPRELPMYFPNKMADVSPDKSLYTTQEVAKFRKLAYQKLAPRFQRAIEWGLFVQRDLPAKYICLIDSENLYREYLLKKYGSIEGINKAQGLSYKTASTIFPPYREMDFIEVYDQRKDLRWFYVTRNFTAVVNFVALQGPAMFNTLILVLLTVGTHLTVSPFAAYVLSRFRLPYTYKVLLFLIATMAFPAEVASVPNFLLIKKMHLFNTYWALVLPGLANGFGIFILKSFFDSLPEELFEAARMDGAGELRQLWNVAIPLIKPILAINVLGSFTAAYGGFMWAFLVCRKQEMWTLMVYLYQFQMSSGSPSLMMAALVVASLPILILFIFTQRIILRGIILPQFK